MRPLSVFGAALLLSCASGLVARNAFAQTAPEPTTKAATSSANRLNDLINKGRALYDDQQYEESIQVLSGALVRPDGTKVQRLEILRLLSVDYITLNRKEEAESSVRALYSLEPGFTLPATESPRFRDFFSSTKTKWEAEGRPGLVIETEPPPVVSMTHASPAQGENGEEITLNVKVTDPGKRIRSVKLYYRTGSSGKYQEQLLSMHAGTGQARIPSSAVKPPLVEYYFEGDGDGNLAIIGRGDASSPLRIAIPEPSNKGWILPVAIGAGVLGAAAIVGGLALAGVFTKPTPIRTGTVSVTVE